MDLMINLIGNTKLNAAIARAKANKLKARLVNRAKRAYSVFNAKGVEYVVCFSRPSQDKHLALCGCEAGGRGQLCYHVAAVAGLDNYLFPASS
jgi:hypothetical protein